MFYYNKDKGTVSWGFCASRGKKLEQIKVTCFINTVRSRLEVRVPPEPFPGAAGSQGGVCDLPQQEDGIRVSF